MIVKMKKLTLLCTPASQEQALEKLRELEVVHVEHVKSPESKSLDQARAHLSNVHRAQSLLNSHPDTDPTGKDPDQLVDTVWELLTREKDLQETLQALQHEVSRITPFGEFDPRHLHKLRNDGVIAKLYELPVKDTPETPEDVTVVEINRDKTTIYVLALSRNDFTLPAHEIRIPDRSLSENFHQIEKAEKALKETEAEFQTYAGDKKLADAIADNAADAVTYLEVQSGMGAEKEFTYLHGFYPVDREEDIITAAGELGWGYQFEDVTPEDEPPTLLRNPKWVEPIKAILDVIGVVPGYRELDVSALFLIFFSIFFAFIVGDGGYGLLFIALTLVAKAKLKGNVKARPAINLMLLMSTCCVFFGILTGNFFGIPIEALPAPLQGLSNAYMTGRTVDGWDPTLATRNLMFICFCIGVVHLTIARVWNFILKINSFACLDDLGWLCSTWALFSIILKMVLYVEMPAWVNAIELPLLGVGIGLVTLNIILSKTFFGLVTLALDVINNFVDIISYVRLYAVGAASLAIAQAFNGMALDMGFGGVSAIGAALILFAGHALNIILALMGVLVHGIRLNTLEFSGHAGVQWGGSHFNPFRKTANNL